VVRRISAEGTTEILLVHRPQYDDWTFPKGKLERGESDEGCALREVREETGYRCELGSELTTTRYLDRRGRSKTVRYWAMEALEGRFEPNAEVDQCRWLDLSAASDFLTYPHDLALVREVSDLEVIQASILLLRHATAGSRMQWNGDDKLRPLDDKGRFQSIELAETLVHYPIKRIVSSPYLRCTQSVEPLAERLGLDVETTSKLAEGADAGAVRSLVTGPNGHLTLLCSHGDVIQRIVGPDSPNRKGGVWVLRRDDDKLRPVRYLPAPR
jgi:8-oxo-(d)GTP phosphatase